MVQVQQSAGWAEALESLHSRLAPHFARTEPRQRVRVYVEGLLGGAERRNGWHLAEAAGEATPYGMQRLVASASWNADQVRDDLQQYVVEHLGTPDAVLVLDETGFLKKGSKSAGVARQYSGTAGRIENCQIGVFLAYAAPEGVALMDRALYLPKAWTEDRARCREAGIPDEVGFATKPQLARRMLERAFAAEVPHRWITADEIYGHDRRLRLWLEEQEQPFVLAVSSQEKPWIWWEEAPRQIRVDQIATRVPEEGWHRLSAGSGSKGERLYDWALIELFRWGVAPGTHRLLVRRSLENPEERAYYITFSPQGATLEELVQVAGSRWMIEIAFEAAKQEVGLDQYEVRKWAGWCRFITLAMFAHAFLAVQRAGAEKGDPAATIQA
ncbi:MAG TPA: IS701 family transposase [Chloroflexota bacterium]|nr:IS701 family transposase [Chloroflexota bacterium]